MNDKHLSGHVKILLEIEQDNGNCEVESVWAVPEHGGYRLDNIPFYARGFACGDVVAATPDPDGLLRCTGLVAASGHSTIRLWFADAGDVLRIRDELRTMRCDSELNLSRLVAVDVPSDVTCSRIREYLDDKEHAGILEYEEGCLGQSTSWLIKHDRGADRHGSTAGISLAEEPAGRSQLRVSTSAMGLPRLGINARISRIPRAAKVPRVTLERGAPYDCPFGYPFRVQPSQIYTPMG